MDERHIGAFVRLVTWLASISFAPIRLTLLCILLVATLCLRSVMLLGWVITLFWIQLWMDAVMLVGMITTCLTRK